MISGRGYRPNSAPRDDRWGERYFYLTAPTGFRLVAAEAPSQRHENASGPHRVKLGNTR